jgi:DNA recombination protein RmuC
MPADPTLLPLLLGGAVLVLLVLLALWAGRAKAEAGRLRGEVEAIRAAHQDCGPRFDEISARHGTATGEVARLTESVARLESQLEQAARDRERHAADARAERDVLSGKLDRALGEVKRLEVANGELRTKLDARAEAHEQEVALLRELRSEMADRFKALADETLKDHGERFGALSGERMAALLEPMRTQVEHFQKELRDAHSGAAKDRERLKTEIEQLTRRSEQVSREAVALTNALKGEKQKQGAWGEMILERLLEESGLTEGRDYETQLSVRDEEGGRRRPDVVIRLPGGKAVVVDAKVSLVAYEAAVNAEDEATRATQLRAHIAACRRHIDDLAGRDYAAMVGGSVDYVLMFMPVEGALAAALGAQGDLTAYAIAKRVGIATPTTLMMVLRTIQHVWTVEMRQRNAEEIADRAGKLHDKMALAVEAFANVGTHLERARSEHSTALDRLTRGGGNVIGQIDKLRQLGARTAKTFPVEFDPAEDGAARALAAPAE